MIRALLALIAIATIAAALTGRNHEPHADRPATAPSPAPTATSTAAPRAVATPRPPALDHDAINRQDRTGQAHRAREARLFDTRPLLSELPLELADVRIDLAGLHRDGHTLILGIEPGPRSRAYALRVYQGALHTFGDSGSGYRLQWR
jgi:hypothetical protein